MPNNMGQPITGHSAWNATGMRVERRCAVCKKLFMASPEHRYRKGEKWLCSYTCLRAAQNKCQKPKADNEAENVADCLNRIVDSTKEIASAKTEKERNSAMNRRRRWLNSLEEFLKYGE